MKNINMKLIATAADNTNALADIVILDGYMEISIGRIMASKDNRGPWVNLRVKRNYIAKDEVKEAEFLPDSRGAWTAIKTMAIAKFPGSKISSDIGSWERSKEEGLSFESLGIELVEQGVTGYSVNFSVVGQSGLEYKGFSLNLYKDGTFSIGYPRIIWGDDRKSWGLVSWNNFLARGVFEQQVFVTYADKLVKARKEMLSKLDATNTVANTTRRTTRRQAAEKSPDNQEQAIGAIDD